MVGGGSLNFLWQENGKRRSPDSVPSGLSWPPSGRRERSWVLAVLVASGSCKGNFANNAEKLIVAINYHVKRNYFYHGVLRP